MSANSVLLCLLSILKIELKIHVRKRHRISTKKTSQFCTLDVCNERKEAKRKQQQHTECLFSLLLL